MPITRNPLLRPPNNRSTSERGAQRLRPAGISSSQGAHHVRTDHRFPSRPPRARESGFVPQPTSPEAAAARAATNRESFLPWTIQATSLPATSPGSLRSPSRTYFLSSNPSAEPARSCSPNERQSAEKTGHHPPIRSRHAAAKPPWSDTPPGGATPQQPRRPPSSRRAQCQVVPSSFLGGSHHPPTTLTFTPATCPTGSLRSPPRAYFPSSTPSAETTRAFGLN